MQQFYSWLNELSYFVQRVLSFLLESDRLAEMCDSAHHPMPLFPGVLQPVALGWKSESREGCDTRAASSQPLAAGRDRGGGLCPVSARPWWGGGESHGSGQLTELPLEPSSPCHTRVAPLNSVTSAVGPGEWGEGKGTGSRQCASASPLLSQAPVILLSFQQLLETGAATCSEELAEVWRAWSAGEKRCRGWFGGLGARVLPISSLPRQRCLKRTVRLLASVLNLAVQE